MFLLKNKSWMLYAYFEQTLDDFAVAEFIKPCHSWIFA